MISSLNQTPQFWLTLEECESIFHVFREKIDFDEPIPAFGTRFEGRLESIIESVRQTFGETYLNPTVLDAASAYFYQLITGHAFQNGNKRLGVLYTHFFLWRNKVELKLTFNELMVFAVLIAQGRETVDPGTARSATKEIFARFSE